MDPRCLGIRCDALVCSLPVSPCSLVSYPGVSLYLAMLDQGIARGQRSVFREGRGRRHGGEGMGEKVFSWPNSVGLQANFTLHSICVLRKIVWASVLILLF